MGHKHAASGSEPGPSGWVDGILLGVGLVAVSLRSMLTEHPVLLGVVSALLVGMVLHRVLGWIDRPERGTGHPTPLVRSAPRHSARA